MSNPTPDPIIDVIEIQVPAMPGPPGPPGAPGGLGPVKGTVTTTGLLPTVGNAQGDIYQVGTIAPYALYFWMASDTSWHPLNTTTGPAGPTGTPGPVDTTTGAALTAETTRATAVEATKATIVALTAETTRAVTAEAREITRAMTAEATKAASTVAAGPAVMLVAPVNVLAVGPGATNTAFTIVDLSAVVPARAVAALLSVSVRDTVTGESQYAKIRCNGVTTGSLWADGTVIRLGSATTYKSTTGVCPVDANRKIQYMVAGASPSNGEIYIDVVGYLPGTLA